MRKRSKYRPRGVRLDNLGWVVGGLKRLTQLPHENVIVRARNHDALRSLAAGTGTRADVDIVIGALNMTEALALIRKDLGADWQAEIQAAMQGLLEMARRGAATGRFLFRGPELTAVNLGMEVHDAQLDATTVAELERAMDLVAKVKLAGRATSIVERA